MKKTYYIVVLTLLSFCSYAQTKSIQFETNWLDAIAKASQQNKPIFLDAFTTWCGPCKWLSKNIFTHNEVADYYNANFICVKIDMEKEEGPLLAKQFGIKGYPSLLYFNSKGDLIHRTCGVDYSDTYYKDFIQIAKDAVDPTRQFAYYKNQVASGNASNELHAEYVNILYNTCQDHKEELKRYFSKQKEEDLSNRLNWHMLYEFSSDPESKEFKFLTANKNVFISKYTSDSVYQKIEQVYGGYLKSLAKKSSAANDYQNAKAAISKSNVLPNDKVFLSADMIYFSRTNNWSSYSTVTNDYVTKYALSSPDELNEISWFIFENVQDKVLLEKAMGWSKRSTELSPSYANFDTYANILYKVGKNNDAKLAAQKAIDFAKKDGSDFSSTQKLLDLLNGK